MNLYAIPEFESRIDLSAIRVVHRLFTAETEAGFSVVLADAAQPVVFHVMRSRNMPASLWEHRCEQLRAAYNSLIVAWNASGIDVQRETKRFDTYWKRYVAQHEESLTLESDKRKAWDTWQAALLLRPPT